MKITPVARGFEIREGKVLDGKMQKQRRTAEYGTETRICEHNILTSRMQMQVIAGKLEEGTILNMQNMEYLLHNSPGCDWHSTVHRISKCIQSYLCCVRCAGQAATVKLTHSFCVVRMYKSVKF